LKAVPSPFEPIDERAREITEEMVQDAGLVRGLVASAAISAQFRPG
jgi:hypothetical protein